MGNIFPRISANYESDQNLLTGIGMCHLWRIFHSFVCCISKVKAPHNQHHLYCVCVFVCGFTVSLVYTAYIMYVCVCVYIYIPRWCMRRLMTHMADHCCIAALQHVAAGLLEVLIPDCVDNMF